MHSCVACSAQLSLVHKGFLRGLNALRAAHFWAINQSSATPAVAPRALHCGIRVHRGVVVKVARLQCVLHSAAFTLVAVAKLAVLLQSLAAEIL